MTSQYYIRFLFSDPPKASVALTHSKEVDVVKMGDPVYIECNIEANPPVQKIYWKFKVMLRLDILKRTFFFELVNYLFRIN